MVTVTTSTLNSRPSPFLSYFWRFHNKPTMSVEFIDPLIVQVRQATCTVKPLLQGAGLLALVKTTSKNQIESTIQPV